MRLPGAQDVERVAAATPGGLEIPAMTGAGEAMESLGLAINDAAIRKQAKIEAEAERQQRLSDGIASGRALLEYGTQANELLQKWTLEADTTQPEAFRSLNEQLTALSKTTMGALPASMSEEARAEFELRLGQSRLSFSEEGGRVYTTSLQNAAIETISGQVNQYAMQAMASPDRIDDIMDMAAEGLAMFNDTLGATKEKEVMATAGAAIYQAAISGYLGSERVADAENLLNDPRYGTLLTPEQRFTITNRIAAFREAAHKMNVTDSLVTEALAVTAPGATTFAAAVMQVESGGDHDAVNPLSSATGAGQFIDSTWLALAEGEAWTAGKSEAEILAMRNDPQIAAQMVEKYGQQNAARLRAAEVPVDNGSLYLAHFLGPNGAIEVLKADPNTPVDALLPDAVIDANAPVLEGRTAGDVIAWAKGKMGGTATAAPDAPAAVMDPGARLQAAIAYVEAQDAPPEQKRDAIGQLVTQYNRDQAIKQVETDQLFQTALDMVWAGKASEISVAMRADLEQAGLWDHIGAAIYDQATGTPRHTDWLWLNENFLMLPPDQQARVPLADIKAHTDRATYDKIVAARQASESPFYARTTAQYIDDRLAPLNLDPGKRPEDQRALDVFYAEYEAQVSALREKMGREETEEERRAIVDRLAGQIAIKDIGNWFHPTKELPAFRLYDTSDDVTVELAEDIGAPVEIIPEIVRALQSYGIPVTTENVSQAYADGKVD